MTLLKLALISPQIAQLRTHKGSALPLNTADGLQMLNLSIPSHPSFSLAASQPLRLTTLVQLIRSIACKKLAQRCFRDVYHPWVPCRFNSLKTISPSFYFGPIYLVSLGPSLNRLSE